MTTKKDDAGSGMPYRGRSLRLPKHDYSWTGAYFVTVCATTRDPIFEIPPLRAILNETWQALPGRFPGVTLDEFVIMPDHIHGLLWLNGLAPNAPTLGRVMGAYKSLTAVALTTANQLASMAAALSGSAASMNGLCAMATSSLTTATTFVRTPKNWNDANINFIPQRNDSSLPEKPVCVS